MKFSINNLVVNAPANIFNIVMPSPFDQSIFPKETTFHTLYIDKNDSILKITSDNKYSSQNKKMYHLKKIAAPSPRKFLYKESYCKDICPKSEKRKCRLGCFFNNEPEAKLTSFELAENFYHTLSDLEKRITNKKSITIIDKKIKALEVINKKLEHFLEIIREIKTITENK
jgi:hypothetical protein